MSLENEIPRTASYRVPGRRRVHSLCERLNMAKVPSPRRTHNNGTLPLFDYAERQRVRATVPASVRRWARALGLSPSRAALLADLAGIGPQGGVR